MEVIMSSARINRFLITIFVVSLVVLPSGCSKKASDQPVEETADAEAVYTKDDPGAYGGKEDSHLPQVTIEQSANGYDVRVVVDHIMDGETPHYIMWVRIEDGAGVLLGKKEFAATEEKAEAVFELAELPGTIKAFEKCNLHGIWLDVIKTDAD